MDPNFQRLHQAIADATAGLVPAQLTVKTNDKWSIAEILEHLYLTYTPTTKAFQRCVVQNQSLASPRTLKNFLQTFVVVGLGYLPEGRKAPERTSPRGMPAENLVSLILSEIAAMDTAASACRTALGPQTRAMDHPVLGPFTVDQWSKFHWVHGRHHVKQILARRAAMQ